MTAYAPSTHEAPRIAELDREVEPLRFRAFAAVYAGLAALGVAFLALVAILALAS